MPRFIPYKKLSKRKRRELEREEASRRRHEKFEDRYERRKAEIEHILTLMHREDLKAKVYAGSERYLPDEKTAVDSPPPAIWPRARCAARPKTRCM